MRKHHIALFVALLGSLFAVVSAMTVKQQRHSPVKIGHRATNVLYAARCLKAINWFSSQHIGAKTFEYATLAEGFYYGVLYDAYAHYSAKRVAALYDSQKGWFSKLGKSQRAILTEKCANNIMNFVAGFSEVASGKNFNVHSGAHPVAHPH